MGFHDEWLTRFDGETYMGMYRRTLGEEGASAIARFLARNASVTKIDLSINEIGPGGAAEIGQALAPNPALREFNLCLNPIGDAGAAGIAAGLAGNASIEELDLHGDAIGPAGMTKIAEALCGHATLRNVTLYSNKGGDEACAAFAEAFSRSPRLASVNLGANGLTPAGIGALLSRGLGALRLLVLSHNALGDAGMAALAAAGGEAFARIEELSLAGCGIGPDGFMELSRVAMPALKVLDISDNNGGSGEGIATALHSAWPSLVDLDLTSTRVSLATIAPAATSHKALNKISLGGTGVASDGIAALCRGIESGGGQLGTIDLSDNDLCTADAEALTAACRVNRTLEELILYGNDDIDDDATEALEDVLSDMSRLE